MQHSHENLVSKSNAMGHSNLRTVLISIRCSSGTKYLKSLMNAFVCVTKCISSHAHNPPCVLISPLKKSFWSKVMSKKIQKTSANSSIFKWIHLNKISQCNRLPRDTNIQRPTLTVVTEAGKVEPSGYFWVRTEVWWYASKLQTSNVSCLHSLLHNLFFYEEMSFLVFQYVFQCLFDTTCLPKQDKPETLHNAALQGTHG